MNIVHILGGGVAGLSAAHELADRGFDVVVYEKNDICGGKARSMKYSAPGRNDLPGEHGFRFFPGFYWHLSDTMSRIVVDAATGRTAFDNLQTATEIGIAQDGKPLFRIAARHPQTVAEWVDAIRDLVESPSLGIPKHEAKHFLHRVFCFVGSGRKRRLADYEQQSWWDYIGAGTRSPQYQAVLARGLSQSLVAMRPDKASALTVGTMLVQIVFNVIEGKKADRVLNAPTNEAWIDPWVQQLRANPKVRILNGHELQQILYNASTNTVDQLVVRDSATNTTLTIGTSLDYVMAALPVEVIQNQALFSQAFKRAAGLSRQPTTGAADDGVDKLETEWMSGVLFYLNRPVSALHGHIIYAHSRWSLTSISQQQFWRPTYPWPTIGNGQVRDILSAIISDWNATGNKVVTTTARASSRSQIFDETWAQLQAHLSQEGAGAIHASDVVDRFIDPAIKFDAAGYVVGNDEPLLINTRASRQHRPGARTLVNNFVVASDYVLTETDLACMEAANEAARQAVNAVLDMSGSTAVRCHIEPLHEPLIFRVLQDADDLEYTVDPARPPLLCQLLSDDSSGVASPSSSKGAMLLAFLGGVGVTALAALLYFLLQ